MRTIKTWLTTMAVLLCSVTQIHAEFIFLGDWTSDNQYQDSSTSTKIYTFCASEGATLSFDWSVSSESGYDRLSVVLDDEYVLVDNMSGERTGSYHGEVEMGDHTMVVTYIKDGSHSAGNDQAKLFNIKVENPDITEVDGISYMTTSNSTVAVIGVADMADVTIPNIVVIDEVEYSVNEISAAAFYSCISLTTVSIPVNVTEIKAHTFENCKNLTSVSIPNALRTIGDAAFKGCESMTSITIPDSVTTIGARVFDGCLNLTSVVVAENNRVYDSREGCNAIIETSTNTLIRGCNTTVIPSTVTSIGNSAFEGCGNLASITIPKSVTEIGNYVFNGCTSLREVVIEDGNELLTLGYNKYSSNAAGQGLFYSCPLETLYLGRNLSFSGSQGYGYSPFYYAYKLTAVTMGDSITSLNNYLFCFCIALEEVTIPANVTSIGDDPFYGCSKMRTLRSNAVIPPYCSANFNSNIRVVYVLDGSGAAYENASYWSNRTIIDGEGGNLNIEVETPGTLGEKILEHVEYLHQVNFLTISGTLNDDDIYNIKNRMTKLVTIDMSKVNMTALPNYMFDGHYSLLQVKLPDNLQSIGQYAFRDCYSLADIELPNSLKTIGSYAFEDCDYFTNVIIPEGVTSVGEYAFYNCGALETVYWPSTATVINGYTFYQSGIDSIFIADGVTTIGSYAFYDSSLKELVCPSTLKSISSYAFEECSSLSRVVFNEGLTTLNNRSFCNCDRLTSIVLPSTLNYCDRPFYNCNNITSVTCLALLPPTLQGNYDIIYNVNKDNCVLYVPEWTINKYKLTVGWDDFPTIEPIKGYWPENISIMDDFSLVVPDTLPTEYKPNLSLLYDNDYGYGSLTLTGDATLSVGTYYMEHSNSYQDYKYGYSSLLVNTDMRADNVVVGLFTRNDQWRFISFPFDAKVSDIFPAYNNTNFVIRRYSGKDRAEQNFGNTWQDLTIDSVLYAGEGYILQSSRYYSDGEYANWSGFYFYAVNNANKNLIFAKDNRTVVLNEYQSEFSHNRSWNLIGNPYPCFYDTRAMDFTAPITVWDPFNSTYYAYSPVDDEYILSPTEAFFVQRPVDTESITFAADGRQTDRVVRNRATQAKAYTRSANMRQVFNLTLSDGEMSDRTRFVINPDAACDYEMATDANKFMSSDARAAQLYTIEDDVQFAINERPMGNGIITLGAYFGSQGNYTIALDTKVEGMSIALVDKVTGIETDLMSGSYTFTAEAGTVENRFEIRMKAGDVTGVENLNGQVSIKAIGGQIIVNVPHESSITIYNAEGQRIAESAATSVTFDVEPGIYMVKVQDTVHKVSVTR